MNFTPLASPSTRFFFEAVLPSVTLEKNDLENHAELGQTTSVLGTCGLRGTRTYRLRP
jgi:hypothetical protein